MSSGTESLDAEPLDRSAIAFTPAAVAWPCIASAADDAGWESVPWKTSRRARREAVGDCMVCSAVELIEADLD